GLLAVGGCEKNMPGCVMAMARLNVPGVFVYGGSILPGVGPHGEDVDIVSIFEAVGQFQAKAIDAAMLHKVECASCPGHGSCGGMYTANTMSSAIEAMGLSLPYGASNPAVSAAKEREAFRAGQAVMHCIEKNIRPRDIITRKSLENAYTLVLALGDCITMTRRTLAENLAEIPSVFAKPQKVVLPFEKPMFDHGIHVILKGNLAPEGAVAKVAGLKQRSITGPAKVFDGEEACFEAI